MDRAINLDGTELHQDVLGIAAEGLERAVRKLVQESDAGNLDAINQLMKLSQEEFARARSGANDPVLLRVKEIRDAGSQMNYDLWQKLYRNGIPVMEEPI